MKAHQDPSPRRLSTQRDSQGPETDWVTTGDSTDQRTEQQKGTVEPTGVQQESHRPHPGNNAVCKRASVAAGKAGKRSPLV